MNQFLIHAVADKYPSASVVGVDLSPIQPSWVPPNLKFLVDDIEDEWMHGDDFDFVHMRCISPWLKDEVKVLRQAYEYTSQNLLLATTY